MTLIGLGHKARQGKNYVANYMKEEDNRVKLYAFADELKFYCRDHHDELLPQWQLCHQTKQQPAHKDDPIYGYTPILQWYGTDVARKANPNIWVEKLAEKLETEKPDIAVITDVRFPNEAEYIKTNGGFLVDVVRWNADGTQYRDSSRPASHPSEIALDEYLGWDFIIAAKDGDLKGLRAKSIGVLNILKNKYGSFDELVKEYYEIEHQSEEAYDAGVTDAEYAQYFDSDGTGFKS